MSSNMKQGEGMYSEAERRRMVEQEQHFVAHPDAYRSAQSESEAAQLRKERMLRECSKQANIAGIKAGGATAAACIVADYILQRTSQSYRCRVEITGKALTGAVLAYGAFYLKSYLVDRECIRKDAQFVNRQHGVVGRPIKLTDPSSMGK